MNRVRAIVTDIEGTTSTIAFVHEVLFPYADAHLDGYVAAHRTEPVVDAAMREAAALIGNAAASDADVLVHLHRWIAEDRKATPLKTLQGLIWSEGYAQSGLRGHVYDDVAPALRAWHAAGIKLYIYSSGSIVAQKVLFGNSSAGDLLPLFSGHFDTTIGAKRERASYTAIAAAIACEPRDVLFLSDVDAELDAARDAGMQTARLVRPADTPPGATTTHPAYVDFTAIPATAAPPVMPSGGSRSEP